MRTFAPAQRIDQAAEYATSVHGKRLAAGDMKVATCVNCHGAHGIRNVSDAKSPVYALNVAATCARCHANPEHMAGYKTAAGPLPTNQYENYQKSVHFDALTKKQDLSAPTCNDCHGNHGASPPGVGAVANVCGTCHAVFADRFASSPHKEVFDRGCVECHSNHDILKPSDTMLGMGAGAICSTCHDGDAGAKAATAMRASIDSLRMSIERSDGLLEQLHNAGLEVGEDRLRLREAQNHLTLARTEVHTFRGPRSTRSLGRGWRSRRASTRLHNRVSASSAFGNAASRFPWWPFSWSWWRSCSRFETSNAGPMAVVPYRHRSSFRTDGSISSERLVRSPASRECRRSGRAATPRRPHRRDARR